MDASPSFPAGQVPCPTSTFVDAPGEESFYFAFRALLIRLVDWFLAGLDFPFKAIDPWGKWLDLGN